MKQIALTCYPFVRSCVDCGGLVQVGETVYIYTTPDRFTDEVFPGYISATVKSAFLECDNCYSYVLEYDEADLPDGIAAISQCDVASIGCEPCPPLDLRVSAGTSAEDESGGTTDVVDQIHFWSDSLVITADDVGRVRIELPGSYEFIN